MNRIFKLSTYMFILCFVIIAKVKVVEASQLHYSDIDEHWAQDTIIKWSDHGVIKGGLENCFYPDRPVTKAEIVTLVNRVLGLKSKTLEQFDDVSEDSWCANDMLIAKKAGYLNLFDNRIQPNRQITRLQAVTLIDRAFKLESNIDDTVELEFIDNNSIGQYAKSAIQRLTSANVINGYPDGAFRPYETITRAELISIIDNLIGTYINKDGQYNVSDTKGIIIVNSDNVDIKDSHTSNQIILSENVNGGHITISNSELGGNIYVNCSNNSKIQLKNCKVSTLLLVSNDIDKSPIIELSKESEIKSISINTTATVKGQGKVDKISIKAEDVIIDCEFDCIEVSDKVNNKPIIKNRKKTSRKSVSDNSDNNKDYDKDDDANDEGTDNNQQNNNEDKHISVNQNVHDKSIFTKQIVQVDLQDYISSSKEELMYTVKSSAPQTVTVGMRGPNIAGLNAINKGECVITITAVDSKGNVVNKNLNVNVIDAPVIYSLKYDQNKKVKYISFSINDELFDNADELCLRFKEDLKDINIYSGNSHAPIHNFEVQYKGDNNIAIYLKDNNNLISDTTEDVYVLENLNIEDLNSSDELFSSEYNTIAILSALVTETLPYRTAEINDDAIKIDLNEYFYIPLMGYYQFNIEHEGTDYIDCKVEANNELVINITADEVAEEVTIPITIIATNGLQEVKQSFSVTISGNQNIVTPENNTSGDTTEDKNVVGDEGKPETQNDIEDKSDDIA